MPLNIDLQQVLLHLLNTVLLFAILYFLLYKPVRDFMEKRTAFYKDLEEQTGKKLAEAEEVRLQYENRLKKAEQEISLMKAAAVKELAANAEKAHQEAAQRAEEILGDARRSARKEQEKLLSDARHEISEMAAEMAEKIVSENTASAFDRFLTAAERGEEQ